MINPGINSLNLALFLQTQYTQRPTQPSTDFRLSPIHGNNSSLEPLIKKLRLEEERQIRKQCFSFLANFCENLDSSSLLTLHKEIDANREMLDPRAYNALIDKITILEDASRFGNKTANLMALQKLFPEHIPEFEAIESNQIAKYLFLDEDFCSAWENFRITHSGNSISIRSREFLNQIIKRVEIICSQKLILECSTLDFISNANTKKFLIMVRSTGKNEDSDKVMLSGANKTMVAVIPETQSVLDNIGMCLSSYFGPSVDQRVMHGCDVTSSYFVPCLLQRMVGELRPGDPIAVSGVMFTQEPLGPTPQTAIITASYGQGEGIVEGKVACDRILITSTGEMLKSIRHKNYRIGPTAEGAQELVANPGHMRHICCLNKGELLQLQQIKDKLEKFYPGPMDIEFVVVNSHVYIVQARPIVGLERKNPSYIDLSGISQEDLYLGEILASGSNAVVSNIEKGQAIFATSVCQALDIFLPLTDKNNIRAVFVEQGGENLSHFISIFQSLCIPVVALPEAMKLKEEESLHLCPQQNLIKTGDEPFIQQGWQNHPVSGAISLEHPGYPPEAEILFTEKIEIHPISEALQDLKSSDPAIVRRAVASMLYGLQLFIKDHMKEGNPQLKERIKALAAQICTLGKNAYFHAVNGQKLEQLLSAKIIEARMHTAKESRLILEGEGFDKMAGESRLQEQAIRELGALALDPLIGEHVIELHKVGRVILNKTVRNGWLNLLKGTSSFEPLIRLVHWLAKRDLLDLFMNSVFPELLDQKLSPELLLKRMLEVVGHDAAILDWCQRKMKDLDSIESQITLFAKREITEFERTFKKIESIVFEPLLTEFKAERFNSAGVIGRLTILTVYQHCMDLCDGALKAFVDSVEFQPTDLPERQRRFIMLFGPFFELQFYLSTLLNKESADSLKKWGNQDFALTVNAFLAKLRKKWEHALDSKTLDSMVISPNCSVLESMLGSCSMNLDKVNGLIGLWTLSHQNCITLLSVLRKQTCPLISQILSSSIGPIVERLLQLPIPDYNNSRTVATLVHVEFRYPHVQLRFNVPMFHHSAILDLSYNTKSNKAELHLKFIGVNEQLRWTLAFMLAHIATVAIPGLSFVKGRAPRLNEIRNVHTFTWCFDVSNPVLIGEQLQQILMQIFYTCYPRSDNRFKSIQTGRPFSSHSVFEMAKDIFRFSAQEIRTVDILRALPISYLKDFFLNISEFLSKLFIDGKEAQLIEILDDESFQYVRNEMGFIPDNSLLDILNFLFGCESTYLYGHKIIQQNLSFDESLKLLQIGLQVTFSEDDHYFRGTSYHFMMSTLLHFTLIYPSIYSYFKPHVFQYLYKEENLEISHPEFYQNLCMHLTFWSENERIHYLNKLINVGQLFCYLPSEKLREEIKEICVNNCRVTSLLKELLEVNRLSYNPFSLYNLSVEERPQVKARALSEIPEMARKCGTLCIIECISLVSENSEILHALVSLQKKYDIEEYRRIAPAKFSESFFEKTLPLLCTVSPRWLVDYRNEILGLLQADLFNEGFPDSVEAMIADVLVESDISTRHLIYKSMTLISNRNNFLSKFPTGIIFMIIFQYCKNVKIQEEMIRFLKQANRCDLLLCGAWAHHLGPILPDRKKCKHIGKELLRSQFTPEKILSIWQNNSNLPSVIPCEMISEPNLKETALELICGNGFRDFHNVFSHLRSCSSQGDKGLFELYGHLGKWEDGVLVGFLENHDEGEIGWLIFKLYTHKDDNGLWKRYLPLLRLISEKKEWFAECNAEYRYIIFP